MTQKTFNFLENYGNTLEILQAMHKRTEPERFTFIPKEGGKRFPSGGGVREGTKEVE